MPSPAELARLEADLAAARLREDRLQNDFAVAAHTSSGKRTPEAIEADLLAVQADVAELEERREGLQAAPAPALPAPAAPQPEYVSTKDAARILGTSARTLEGLRLRGEGPPCIRLGRRVLYPLATIRPEK